jgi:hypothetical protein
MSGVVIGAAGYAVVHALAAENLALSIPVVVDAVNPVPEARAGWRALARRTGFAEIFLETFLSDPAEHRARVGARQPDMPGQIVPTWDQVEAWPYAPSDESRDGPRHPIDMTSSVAGMDQAMLLFVLSRSWLHAHRRDRADRGFGGWSGPTDGAARRLAPTTARTAARADACLRAASPRFD